MVPLLILLNVTVANAAGEKGEYSVLSTTAGLEFSTVTVSIKALPQYRDQLEKRAQAKLRDAGLIPKSDPQPQFPANIEGSILELTLWAEPVEGCSDKILYTQKLELSERALLGRNPRLKPWVVTWVYGVPSAYVRGPVEKEELEKDLDGLLDTFIKEYNFTNGRK